MTTSGYLTTPGETLVGALRTVYTPDQLAGLHAKLVDDLDAGAPREDPLGILVDALSLGAHQPPTPPATPKETRRVPAPSPIVALRDGYQPHDYNHDPYIEGAAAFLSGFGVLPHLLSDNEREAVKTVLAGLDDLDLDVTDVYPFGVVWALRSTGAIDGSPELDAALADWRKWEETDHLGEPLTFLPDLPDGS